MASTVSKGIWSNFTKRSQSLGIKSQALQKAILSPTLPNGPVSLKTRKGKIQYNSPIGMNKIYPLAYEILEKQSEKLYSRIEVIDEEISKLNQNQSDLLKELNDEKNNLLIEAERYNPEVIYTSNYIPDKIDRTQPVYRDFLQKKWENYNKMLIMQRIEQLGVIPDTLPTLEPEVDVRLKFPNTNIDTWIEPGSILSSNVTSKPPSIEITEFKDASNELYTILIVDPDVPDIKNNSFSTTLHWGLKDVKLNNVDYLIDAKKLLSNQNYEFVEYLPPIPEKNTGKHRYAIWIFRQENAELLKNAPKDLNREDFNIREFVKINNLKPIGAHVFRSVWDRNTESVREMYGLPKGRIFANTRY